LPEITYRPAPLSARIRAVAQNWLLRYGEHRLKRELNEYQHPPEIRTGFRFGRPRADRPQVFRSFLQVNLYPRPRHTRANQQVNANGYSTAAAD
jgi:hypothetical protein